MQLPSLRVDILPQTDSDIAFLPGAHFSSPTSLGSFLLELSARAGKWDTRRYTILSINQCLVFPGI